MATAQTLDGYIERTPGVLGGKPRIAGRRIAVQHVAVWHERMGVSADAIATEYDLSLAEVHAALTYYWDHRVEINEAIHAGAAFAAEMRARTPSKVRQKLDGAAD